MKASEKVVKTAWKVSEVSAVLGEMTCSGGDDDALFCGHWELGYFTLSLTVDKKGNARAQIYDGPEVYGPDYDHSEQCKQWDKVCLVAGRLHLVGHTEISYGL